MDNDKNIETPTYQIAESLLQADLNVCIFDLNLEQLIFEKMYILFEKYQKVQKQKDAVEVNMQQCKDKLLLEIDFEKELEKKRPTIAEKDAYMKPHLQKFEEDLEKLSYDLQFYKNKLAIINDLIKSRRLMLKIENALSQE